MIIDSRQTDITDDSECLPVEQPPIYNRQNMIMKIIDVVCMHLYFLYCLQYRTSVVFNIYPDLATIHCGL